MCNQHLHSRNAVGGYKRGYKARFVPSQLIFRENQNLQGPWNRSLCRDIATIFFNQDKHFSMDSTHKERRKKKPKKETPDLTRLVKAGP